MWMNVMMTLTTVIKPVPTLMGPSLVPVRMVSHSSMDITVLVSTVELEGTFLLGECVQSLHTDDDECGSDNGGCAQLCMNTPSSFVCGCREGYVLSSDGINCNGNPS
jgi:hypothetical protein